MQNTRIGIVISNLKSIIVKKLEQRKINKLNAIEANIVNQRKFVGNIIISVLTERINVRRGLLLFPQGADDESIKTAWHALCHYEADEDLRKKDTEYNDEQIAFLEMIAFEFKDGNPLPQNIIDSYKPYYQNNPISYENNLSGLIKKLLRFLSII